MRVSISVCAALLSFFVASVSAAELPNIILCMADDQGWGDVGYYGKSPVKTPVLDEMAAAGLRFDRFYAAAPVCSPTRASVLTGRHPNRTAVFKWGHPLRPQETMRSIWVYRG
jgi:arylsulfatase A-like enzyme